MLLSRTLVLAALTMAVPGLCVWASEGDGTSPTIPPVPPLALDRQTGNTEPAAAPAVAAPPALPSASALAPELGERLARNDGNAAAADREDRAALGKFYEARQGEPVWMAASGLNQAGRAAVTEIARANDWGLDAAAFRLPNLPGTARELARTERADAEIAISLAVLKYARQARGGRAEPTSLSRNIDRQLSLLAPANVIEAAATAEKPDAYLRGLNPKHPQFELLRQKYLALKRGQPVAGVDTEAADDDGKAGRKKPAAPEGSTLQKLLVNMEQWRWMPNDLGDFYVWVNVPEFLIRVVKGGKVIHTERVVVGKPDTQTPIFSDEMEQVIFHPFWGVPDSIKKADIQPSLARGSSRVLERYNLRIQYNGKDIDPAGVDWATADMRKFHVYQPPGGENLLGVVKFRFPNKHDVYMHDTPQKNLFNLSVRANSHGCMRVRDPQRLAELLLAADQGWPASRVAAAVNGGPPNNQINLKQKIPVHITYFTAAVEEDGKLKLFGDIYGHEKRIALGLEGKTVLLAQLVKAEKAPVSAEPIGNLAETANPGSRFKKDWQRRAFEN
jgi:murein L,D-transpeptidase YcbB/YkuD